MKRKSVSILTTDNWDEEDPEECAGEFQRATKEELEQRKISKARKRVNTTKTSSTSSIFGGFSGFVGQMDKNLSTGSSISSTFSFLSKIQPTEKSVSDCLVLSDNKVNKTNETSIKSLVNPDKPIIEGNPSFTTNLNLNNANVADSPPVHEKTFSTCVIGPICETIKLKNSLNCSVKEPSIVGENPNFDVSENKSRTESNLNNSDSKEIPFIPTDETSTSEHFIKRNPDQIKDFNEMASSKLIVNTEKPVLSQMEIKDGIEYGKNAQFTEVNTL